MYLLFGIIFLYNALKGPTTFPNFQNCWNRKLCNWVKLSIYGACLVPPIYNEALHGTRVSFNRRAVHELEVPLKQLLRPLREPVFFFIKKLSCICCALRLPLKTLELMDRLTSWPGVTTRSLLFTQKSHCHISRVIPGPLKSINLNMVVINPTNSFIYFLLAYLD